MLYAPSLTVFTIVKKLEIQARCSYSLTTKSVAVSANTKMNLVSILVKLKKKCPEKASKIQRLIDHFAFERDNLVVLKP